MRTQKSTTQLSKKKISVHLKKVPNVSHTCQGCTWKSPKWLYEKPVKSKVFYFHIFFFGCFLSFSKSNRKRTKLTIDSIDSLDSTLWYKEPSTCKGWSPTAQVPGGIIELQFWPPKKIAWKKVSKFEELMIFTDLFGLIHVLCWSDYQWMTHDDAISTSPKLEL